MNKHKMLYGFVVVLLCCLMICGCTQQQPPTSKIPIKNILAKANTIGFIKYDVVIATMINGNYTNNRTMTIWEEPPYMKFNLSAGPTYHIIISRPEGTYVNIPGTQKFTKINITFPERSLITQSNALLSNITFRVLGNETFDGNTTTVLQYTTNLSGGSMVTKVWIWNDKGIPLKTQTTEVIREKTVITTTVFKNFVFDYIPLKEFSIG